MRKLTTGFAAVVLILAATSRLQATPEYANLQIVELQTASALSASDEFVEIYNPNTSPLPLDGISLQYKSSQGANWQTKAELTGLLPPRGRAVVATQHLEAQFAFNSGFAGSGGHIRLFSGSDLLEHDLLGWGSAANADGDPALAPTAGNVIKRLVDEDGYFIDTNNNALDWLESQIATPATLELVDENSEETDESQDEEVEADDDSPVDDENNDDTEVADDDEADPEAEPEPEEDTAPVPEIDYPTIDITELFIDPEKPLTDAEDEFVELYNPNTEPVQLEGYELQTGATFRYKFILPAVEIGPGEFLAFYSLDTGLTLSNSSGGARLLAPDQTIVSETAQYESAKAGISWVLESGVWGWSAVPSPDGENKQPVTGDSSDARQQVTQARRATTASKAASTKAAEEDDSAAERSIYQEPETEETDTVNKQLLAGMGTMTVLYAGYEYRGDIGNRIYQLRRYLSSRRKTG